MPDRRLRVYYGILALGSEPYRRVYRTVVLSGSALRCFTRRTCCVRHAVHCVC